MKTGKIFHQPLSRCLDVDIEMGHGHYGHLWRNVILSMKQSQSKQKDKTKHIKKHQP